MRPLSCRFHPPPSQRPDIHAGPPPRERGHTSGLQRQTHTPRARRSPWQVHQKCPGEKHNSLETAAVNREKVPRAALAKSKRSLGRWASVWFIHLLYLFGKTRLSILHSGTICSLVSEEEAGETALSDDTAWFLFSEHQPTSGIHQRPLAEYFPFFGPAWRWFNIQIPVEQKFPKY